jgi:hypothetical protein
MQTQYITEQTPENTPGAHGAGGSFGLTIV